MYIVLQVSSALENTSTSRTDAPKEGHCIWYGECNSRNNLKQNCPYNGPGKPLNNPKGEEILNRLCPHLDVNSVCCDTTQLTTMDTNLLLPGSMLKR